MQVKFNRSVTIPGSFDPPFRSDFAAGEIVDANIIPGSYLAGLLRAKHCEETTETPVAE